ncbi:uncharacterized protein DUF3304 [Pseudomonas sp. SJZ080]|uniref:DUF3304 domain-containing protein n=1 Tax=Pseudomonas sp. SJZ080 TaxID=2572888 RepID=UPI0011998689|nr:DUF3304 domain-containing protein [Pseudomonas sp. SJZ080]TWC50960.1 uncharacterized protein DUF3304 [Pseudomonas sp. SJZ080]
MFGSLIGLIDRIGSMRNVGLLLLGMLAVSGCGSSRTEMLGTSVSGYNHTSAAINRFSINGGGGPNIGPFQGGLASQVCCAVIPAVWTPGLKAVVKWEKDPDPYAQIRRDQNGQIDTDAYRRHAADYSSHEAVVEIPKYAENICALQVHFFPCDQVRVSTTCFTPEHPDYPDHAYFQLKESTGCSVL